MKEVQNKQLLQQENSKKEKELFEKIVAIDKDISQTEDVLHKIEMRIQEHKMASQKIRDAKNKANRGSYISNSSEERVNDRMSFTQPKDQVIKNDEQCKMCNIF